MAALLFMHSSDDRLGIDTSLRAGRVGEGPAQRMIVVVGSGKAKKSCALREMRRFSTLARDALGASRPLPG
jgi:hypothetical protein